jgi:DNA-binding LytR/AlgR family response regulator
MGGVSPVDFFAYKRKENKESDELEKINSGDICYITTDGKKIPSPIAFMLDGSEYKMTTPFETLKLGLVKYDHTRFKVIDRLYIVNFCNVEHYDDALEIVFFKTKIKMIAPVSKSYLKSVREVVRSMGLGSV